MLELAFICYVAVSQPFPPPKPKEVYIERLIGLPAKELEFTSLIQREKKQKDETEPDSRVRKPKFGNSKRFKRRGNRNH